MKVNKYINISNIIETSTDNEIILLNNEYHNKTILIIISEDAIKEKKIFKLINFDGDLNFNDSTLLISNLKDYCNDKTEAYFILSELIETLNDNKANGYYETDNKKIIALINDIENKINNDKETQAKEQQKQLIKSLQHDINIILEKVTGKEDNPKNLNEHDLPRYLAKYLNLKYGLIVRSNVGTPHLLNTENNCYELTDSENILKLLAKDFGDNNISMKHIKPALDYINDRMKPEYNIIRFNNCIYDMNQHEIVNLSKATLPYYDIYFNYNPEAKGELIQKFLYSSLNENQVKGLLELIGYLFTVGNKENIITCFIGKGGGGKSVLSNILSYLFKRVSNLPIHNLNKSHDLMSLENSLLNICNDTDNTTIKDNGTFKQITGGDSLYINPKYRDPYVMPPEEVPYFIIVGNQFPKFKRLEIPIIERLMLVEFKRGFRNTKDQNKNLFDDIINDDDNIEWLLYNSLKAYKEMNINNNDFLLRKSTKENLDLYNKHSYPLKWLIQKLIMFDDSFLFSDYEITDHNLHKHLTTYIPVNELKQTLLTEADKEGLDIGNSEGILSTQKLTPAIKSAFNLWDLKDEYDFDYKPKSKRGENGIRKQVYPCLIYKDND